MTTGVVAKLFIPLAAPGLASIGIGLVAVTRTGAYDTIQIAAIILGLIVICVAGIFTIRSNVAKIWREQAEGEKVRNDELVARLAETKADYEARLATATTERDTALAALADAKKRTDITEVLSTLVGQHSEVLARLDALEGK